MLFLDESTPHLNIELKKSSRELELLFGLAVVDVLDIQIAEEYNVTTFPSVALYQKCEACERFLYYQKELKTEKNATKSAERVQKWIMDRLEANDHIVTTSITSDAFKSHPDEFKHVCLYIYLLDITHKSSYDLCFF